MGLNDAKSELLGDFVFNTTITSSYQKSRGHDSTLAVSCATQQSLSWMSWTNLKKDQGTDLSIDGSPLCKDTGRTDELLHHT